MPLRLGEEKRRRKKIEITGQKYNGGNQGKSAILDCFVFYCNSMYMQQYLIHCYQKLMVTFGRGRQNKPPSYTLDT